LKLRGILDSKYDQGVQEYYPCDERCEVIAINSNKFK